MFLFDPENKNHRKLYQKTNENSSTIKKKFLESKIRPKKFLKPENPEKILKPEIHPLKILKPKSRPEKIVKSDNQKNKEKIWVNSRTENTSKKILEPKIPSKAFLKPEIHKTYMGNST